MINPSILPYMQRNRGRFDRLVASAIRASSPEMAAQRCEQAAMFAMKNPCGVLYSQPLEALLQQLAAGIPSPAEVPAGRTGRFLHVFTRSYLRGGHTRVCERWIAASDAGHAQDVVLLDQGKSPVPDELARVVAEKQGTILRLDDIPSLIDKAQQLRALAEGYRAVIVFAHSYDVVPMLAFATPDFHTPVVFYNHADHLFWFGVSMADQMVNLRSITQKLDRERRCIAPEMQTLLPLPIRLPDAVKPGTTDRATLMARLGFPADAKLMVSIASSSKFRSFAGLDFLATAKEILAQDPQAVLLAIGPKAKEKVWARACQETGGRIRAIGVVPSDQLDSYLQFADVALESFPLGSITALFDVAKHGVPCVALRTPPNTVDIFEEAGIVCDTPADYVARAVRLLRDPVRDERLYTLIRQHSFPEAFAAQLRSIYAAIPPRHTHRTPPVLPPEDDHISAFEAFIAENSYVNRGGPVRRAKAAWRLWWHCYVTPLLAR